MAITGIDHIQIAAPRGSEEQARRFYADLLGMPEISKPAPLERRGGVWFRAGEQQLHVGVEDEFRPARKAHPCLIEDALEELAKRLRESGREITWNTEIPEIRRFYFADPWGNRIEARA